VIVTEMTSIAERERRDEATGWRGVGARLGVPPRQTQRPEIDLHSFLRLEGGEAQRFLTEILHPCLASPEASTTCHS